MLTSFGVCLFLVKFADAHQLVLRDNGLQVEVLDNAFSPYRDGRGANMIPSSGVNHKDWSILQVRMLNKLLDTEVKPFSSAEDEWQYEMQDPVGKNSKGIATVLPTSPQCWSNAESQLTNVKAKN